MITELLGFPIIPFFILWVVVFLIRMFFEYDGFIEAVLKSFGISGLFSASIVAFATIYALSAAEFSSRFVSRAELESQQKAVEVLGERLEEQSRELQKLDGAIDGGIDGVEYTVQRIFFGTNRAPDGDTSVGPRFGFGSSQSVSIGIADVTIPTSSDARGIGDIPEPYFTVFKVRLWRVPEDPERHFMLHKVEVLDLPKFMSLSSQAAAGATEYPNTAFVFVHGFNVPFRSAVFRTAQIAWDLDFDGPAFLYSWPAVGALLDYGTDLDSARASAPYLDEFLEIVESIEGVNEVHILVHSMGTEALAEVLTQRGLEFAQDEGKPISQLILAAPDIFTERFLQIVEFFDEVAEDITLYASANDRALLTAQSVVRTDKPRLGLIGPDGPIVDSRMYSIDASAVSTEVFGINHNAYVRERTLLDDVGRLLKNADHPPKERMPTLEVIETPSGDYWRIPE